MTTLFGEIINGKKPCEAVFENERIIVIKDIYPIAPVHLLIIPKKEISSLQAATEEDLTLIAEAISIAQKLAKQVGIEDGYRLVTNHGSDAGQTIYHLHFHLIGGRRLGAMG